MFTMEEGLRNGLVGQDVQTREAVMFRIMERIADGAARRARLAGDEEEAALAQSMARKYHGLKNGAIARMGA